MTLHVVYEPSIRQGIGGGRGQDYQLAPGIWLQVTPWANSTGSITRLPDRPGDPELPDREITPIDGEAVRIGPFDGPRRYRVDCFAGEIFVDCGR
jgi:hypothetical protein